MVWAMVLKRYIAQVVAVALLLLLLCPGCDDAPKGCSQADVDRCFSRAGCAEVEVCTLNAEAMNTLCVCLAELGCDQAWYHSYCDDAPYPLDGGCPLCE
jgi:hypothetical protein